MTTDAPTSSAAPPETDLERTAVFVSYSRKDEVFVQQAKSKLEQMGLDVWLDLEDIPPSSNWRDEIQDGIEGCDALIVVVSPDSVASAEVGKEIVRAEDLGKRIIPVKYREVDPTSTHAAVADRNWISWVSADESTEALDRIDQSLKIDPTWAKEHTRLNGLALRWDRHERDRNMLIRGSDLDEAERQVVVDRPSDQPQVTELMREFVTESRRVATRRQRRIVITSITVAAVSIGLAIVAIIFRFEAVKQRDEAVRQRDTATAAALAARAENRLETAPDLAALLALESYRTKDTVDALGSLLGVVDTPTTFVERHDAHDAPVRAPIARHEPSGLTATGDEQGTVLLWDVTEDGAVQRSESIDAGGDVTGLAFDETGTTLSIAVAGAPVQVWDVASSPRQTSVGTYEWYTAVSPGGRLGAGVIEDEGRAFLVAGEVDADEPATVVDLGVTADDLEALFPDGFPPHWPPLAFAPDSSRVAVAIGTRLVVADAAGGDEVDDFDVTDNDVIDPDRVAASIESVTFVGDAQRVAFGINEGNIYLVDLDGDRTPTSAEPAPSSEARALSSLTVEEDGQQFTLLGSAHNNGEIKVWDVEEFGAFEFVTLRGHDEEALAVAVGADGTVTSASWDGDVILSTAFPDAQIRVPFHDPDADTSHQSDVADVEFVDEQLLASLDIDGVVKLWGQDGQLLDTVDAQGVTSLDAVPGLLALGDADGAIAVVDPSTGSTQDFAQDHDGLIGAIAIAEDGSMVVSADETHDVWLWTPDGERVGVVDMPPEFQVGAFAFPSGDVLWIGGTGRDDGGQVVSEALRVDTASGMVVETVRHNRDEAGHSVTSVALSPDGSTLATGGSDRRIFLYDTADTAAPARELTGHFESVSGLVFSDEDVLIASDRDGKILLWDVPAGRQVGALTGPGDGINALDLHPAAAVLAAASEDDNVWVWDLRLESWVDGACTLAGRNMTAGEWEAFQLRGDRVLHCPGDTTDGAEPAEYEGLAATED